MRYSCENCCSEFSTKYNLKQHQDNAKYCKNFAYILFMCKNCFTTFHNIKDIQDHFDEGDCITKKHPKRKNKRKNMNRKSEIIQEVTTLMHYIPETKKYSKLLTQIKAARLNLLNCMSISKYKEFILQHLPELEKKFDKRESKQKIKINKLLSQFELRLIKYKKCTKQIEQTEREHLRDIISSNNCDKFFVYPNFISRLKTDYIYIFSIQELIKYNLSKKNFVYIHNNDKNDLYSFYYLKDKNYWCQDTRLEKLTVDIRSELIPFCINFYRTIYHNIFHDNIYRKDMGMHSPLIEYDMNQVLYNLIFISNFENFNDYLRSEIKDNFNYKYTDNDRLNLKEDDKVQKKNFKILQKENDIYKNINLLFDNITENDLNEFIIIKLKNFELNLEYK